MKTKRPDKLNPSIFLAAAQQTFEIKEAGENDFACHILARIICDGFLFDKAVERPEFRLFAQLFEQGKLTNDGGWWGLEEMDAKIYAFLLCAEIAKSEQKNAK